MRTRYRLRDVLPRLLRLVKRLRELEFRLKIEIPEIMNVINKLNFVQMIRVSSCSDAVLRLLINYLNTNDTDVQTSSGLAKAFERAVPRLIKKA